MFGLVERATQDAGPVELLALPAVEPHAVIDSMSSRATCRGVLPTAGHDAALQSSYAGPSNVRAGAGMHIDRARRIFGRGRRHSGESQRDETGREIARYLAIRHRSARRRE